MQLSIIVHGYRLVQTNTEMYLHRTKIPFFFKFDIIEKGRCVKYPVAY